MLPASPSDPIEPSRARAPARLWWRAFGAAVTAPAGVLTCASALTPNVGWREQILEPVEPAWLMAFGHAVALAGGLGLLALSWGLLRGKRQAAAAAIGVLCLTAVANAVKGLDYEESATAIALALLLAANRRAFARGGEPRRAIAAGTVAVAAITAAYAVRVVELIGSHHGLHLQGALAQAMTPLGSGWWPRSDEPLPVVAQVLLALALFAGAAHVRALLRPAHAAEGHDAADHARAASLVARHAIDSLDPFSLREDKAFFFAHGGFVAYRTLRETAVVSGDPIGPARSVAATFAAFVRFAEERGWDVVVTGASDRYLPAYAVLGLRALQTGNEAVVDPLGFSLEGRSIRKVRQSVTRVERRGWRVELVEARELTPALIDELDEVERAWRAAQPRLQGFAMAMDRLWGAPEDAHDLYVVARAPDGRVHAFLRFLPYRGGLSLDAMRRLGDEPNGLNEALVVAAIGHARERGVSELSLNFAGFAHVMAADAALSRRQRVLRWGLGRMHGRFQLERLVRFNEKFSPTWRPRYLIYGGQTRLPVAALRVLQAEAYLPSPRRRRLPARWQPLPRPVEVPVAVAEAGGSR